MVAALLLAIIWISSALSMWTTYTSTREQASRQIDETLRFVQELVKHDLDTIVASMNTIGEVARQFVQPGLGLADIEWDTPLARTTIVIDPSGEIVADSRPDQPAMGKSVIDREYFIVHTAQSQKGIYIGPNVRSRVDGAWSLPMSLAVRDRNGNSLVVVVSSAVDPVAWGELLLERTRHLDVEVYLTDQNGTILVTSPFEEAALGQDFATVKSEGTLEASQSSGFLFVLKEFLFPAEQFTRSAALEEPPITIQMKSNSQNILSYFLEHAIANFAVSFTLSLIVLIYAFRQHKANAITQRNRSQLLDSLQASSEGFALFDADDRLVVSNSVFRSFYETGNYKIKEGMTFEAMLRAWLAEGAYPAAKGHEEEWIQERLRQHFAAETSIQQLPDGRWLQVSERETAEGGIVSVRTDITELKNQETEIRRSKKRFQDYTNTASDWMWETDADHRFIEVGHSDDVARVIDRNRVLGKRRDQIAPGHAENSTWSSHLDDLENRRPFRDFRYWVNMSGDNTEKNTDENLLVAISGVPIFDDNGTFVGYRGTGRNVTQEYRNNQRIRTNEARFRLMFESIRIGIVLSDEAGRITAVNSAAQETFGYDENEIIGRNVSVLADEEHRLQHDTYLSNYFATGHAKLIGKNRELKAVRKNGEVFPIKLSLAEMVLDGKKQFIASIVDISSEKILEAQLRQSQKMEAVGMMVGGIAHDFNNILGIIIGHLELAGRAVEPETKLAGQISKSLNAANRGTVLISRLLNFSRKSAVQTDCINVNDAVSDLHDLLQRSLTANITIVLELDSSNPMALVNASDFEDAMVNLCLNARDAMPEGGQITIRSSRMTLTNEEAAGKGVSAGAYVLVSVIDNGDGIAEDIRDKIFEPFFTTKDIGRGSGLGLSMVHAFVKRSGGAIHVGSEVGMGATIDLLLPGAEILELHGTGESEAGTKASNVSTGSERILIVDDEPDLAEIAQEYMRDLGYDTKVAHSYLEAVDILKSSEEFDLLLSDIVMPGGQSGYHLANVAHQLRPKIRICLVTGFPRAEPFGNVSGQAVYPVIKKPYSKEVLSVEIRRILDE